MSALPRALLLASVLLLVVLAGCSSKRGAPAEEEPSATSSPSPRRESSGDPADGSTFDDLVANETLVALPIEYAGVIAPTACTTTVCVYNNAQSVNNPKAVLPAGRPRVVSVEIRWTPAVAAAAELDAVAVLCTSASTCQSGQSIAQSAGSSPLHLDFEVIDWNPKDDAGIGFMLSFKRSGASSATDFRQEFQVKGQLDYQPWPPSFYENDFVRNFTRKGSFAAGTGTSLHFLTQGYAASFPMYAGATQAVLTLSWTGAGGADLDPVAAAPKVCPWSIVDATCISYSSGLSAPPPGWFRNAAGAPGSPDSPAKIVLEKAQIEAHACGQERCDWWLAVYADTLSAGVDWEFKVQVIYE